MKENMKKLLNDLSLEKDVIQTQFYFRPKYLYYATIYGLMNKPEQEHAYYDSTRYFLKRNYLILLMIQGYLVRWGLHMQDLVLMKRP